MRVKQKTVTIYLDGKRTSYESPNRLVAKLLGTEHGEAQRRINTAIDFLWDWYGQGLLQPPDGVSKIDYLAELYETRRASIITFALTIHMGYISAGSHISSKDIE